MKFFVQLFNQPKAVFLLSFVQMWNRFSHYGMRALLVLFMIKILKFSDSYAFGIYAVFCALVELGGVLGAYLAEKILGLKRAIIWGGWIVACGHLSLAMEQFFPGLALLIVGSSLFSTNITALIGNFYEIADERRTWGFSLFYMGINIGALLATIFCGLLAESISWSFGFGLAAVGMLIGNIILMKYQNLLEKKGEPPVGITKSKQMLIFPILLATTIVAVISLIGQNLTLPLLPWIAGIMLFLIFRGLFKTKLVTKPNIAKLGIYLSALVFFFAAQEQICSSIVVLTDRMSIRTLFGIPMTSTAIMALNPIVIILFGSVAAYFYTQLKQPFLRFFTPFLLTAIAFSSIVFGQMLMPQLTLSTLMVIVGGISFAELMIGPICYSVCSQMSMQANNPKVMGLIPIGFSLAAILGGVMSKLIAKSGYNWGFLQLSILLLISGLFLSLSLRYLNKKKLSIA